MYAFMHGMYVCIFFLHVYQFLHIQSWVEAIQDLVFHTYTHTHSIYILFVISVVDVVGLSISCSHKFSLILLPYRQYQSWWWWLDYTFFLFYSTYSNSIMLFIWSFFCKIYFVQFIHQLALYYSVLLYGIKKDDNV